MAGRSFRGLWRPLAVAACLVCAAALLTGSPAAGTSTRPPLRTLQLNLCDSGIAGCYTGRSVPQAAGVIRADAPDLVTLNEVCEPDVGVLDRAMAGPGGGSVVSAFMPAVDRRTGGPFRCLDGQAYGIALLVRVPTPGRARTTFSGIYPVQDTRDPEERAWLCVYADAAFYACTTHLASTSATVALAQCRYLLDTAIPAVRAPGGYRPTVLGGDFNLGDLRSCLPPGYLDRGDGGVQHILATADFAVGPGRSIGMGGTTDHPGLLVAMAAR